MLPGQKIPVLRIIFICFLVKVLLAASTELNNDEVYYWTYAQKLQWSYFDHPPVIAVLIKIFTVNLRFDSELMIRLGAIICSAICCWIIYHIGRLIKDEQTGLFSALLFVASPYSNIIAGFLIIPDAPQLMFWLWSVLLMIKITNSDPGDQRTSQLLLMLGLSIGLCILSKVHGVYLWAGFGAFTLLYQRKLWRLPAFYLAMLVSLLFILPIVYWNISNHFITYQYQGNRVSFFGRLQADSFFREIIGELTYNNPIFVILLIITLTRILRKKAVLSVSLNRLLFWLSFPLIMTVWVMAIFNDTLPHWTGPAYTTLIPLTAAAVRTRLQMLNRTGIPAGIKFAVGLTAFLLVLAFGLIKWLPMNIGSGDQLELGKHDVSLDMNGWRDFGKTFNSVYQKDYETGLMKNSSFVISDYWFPAAHINYYVTRPTGIPFLAIGGLTGIHHYAWLNTEKPFLKKGDDAYFISISNYFNPPAPELVSQFEKVLPATFITQYRYGVPVRKFYLYRCKNYSGGIDPSGILEKASALP